MRNRKQRRDYSGKFGEQLPAERKYWLLMLSKKQRLFFFFSGYWRESGRLAVRLEENFLGSADRATVEGSFVRRLGRGFRGAARLLYRFCRQRLFWLLVVSVGCRWIASFSGEVTHGTHLRSSHLVVPNSE
jgi:hypothetical protein